MDYDFKVYEKDNRIIIDMGTGTAGDFKYELSDLTGLAEDYDLAEAIFKGLQDAIAKRMER